MNSEEIVVKNKPVYFDKFFGKRIRSVKRLINTQGEIKSKPIEVQVKNEPNEPENVRSKQESTRETGYMKQHAMKRRNKSTFMPSISLLKHKPTEPQTEDNRSRKSKKTNKRK